MKPRRIDFVSARAMSLALVLLIGAGCFGAEEPKPPAVLTIKGEVAQTSALSADDFLKNLPRQSVHVKEKGQDVTYEGVFVRDVLKRAGLPLGDKKMRSEKLLLYVVAEAADGYKVVFSLADFDSDFTDKVYLIADRRDTQPFSAEEGPLRLVIPSEEFRARWVRQLTTLQILRAPVTQKPDDKNIKH